MIRKIEQSDYSRLMEIWESAVLATHDFLHQKDFIYYKEQLPTYFKFVRLLGFEKEGVLSGFIGVADGNLEMLFVDNNCRRMGVGKELTQFAITNLSVTKVDVNEQNKQAFYFYEHMGFHVVKRSEVDNEGKPYPILHMEL